ncbi:ParB N-terminal domain-containing protein [Nitratireductor aquimarinus]|uniref:ParB N-terminal domain-containing protein n=1 Tax=Nitratireductor aquimarinus TaxID=889300 RepID=UPI0037421BFC
MASVIFQPRELFSDRHVRTLLAAIRAQDGRPLDPITVWHSGKDWYVIDGHHRLEAYYKFNEESPRRRILHVPVKAFTGSLAEAVCKSAEANSKDKLPMRQEDKSNVAWRLVCLQDSALTGKGIARASGVSRRTVQTMRAALRTLITDRQTDELINLTWSSAKRLASNQPVEDWDEDADEKQGAIWAERLGHQFGKSFAANPEAAAFALLYYSPDLPQRLVETEVFKEAIEDHFIARQRAAGIPDEHIFY